MGLCDVSYRHRDTHGCVAIFGDIVQKLPISTTAPAPGSAMEVQNSPSNLNICIALSEERKGELEGYRYRVSLGLDAHVSYRDNWKCVISHRLTGCSNSLYT